MGTRPPLILGSTSRYRRELLERLRLPFEVRAPAVDETPRPGELPAALAQRLALAKAHAVSAAYPDAVVIGSDQVADLDGEPIGKVNFVCRDSKDRIWITISTMVHDWPTAISKDIVDGRVLLYEEGKGVRVVADEIHFSNECKLDATEEHLYVVQTCGRNVVRFKIQPNGDLTDREIFGPSDHGRMIDGIAFDSFGNLWGTHVFTDEIFLITPEGDLHSIYDDSNPAEVKRLDDAFQAGTVNADLLLSCGGPLATWCASITFGGPDLKTVYVGSLRQTKIPYFRSPVAGLPMVHWKH